MNAIAAFGATVTWLLNTVLRLLLIFGGVLFIMKTFMR